MATRNRAPRPEWDDLSSAADRLRVSDRTLKRWGAAGKVKIHKLPGGQLRIRSDEVDRLAKPLRPDEVSA